MGGSSSILLALISCGRRLCLPQLTFPVDQGTHIIVVLSISFISTEQSQAKSASSLHKLRLPPPSSLAIEDRIHEKGRSCNFEYVSTTTYQQRSHDNDEYHYSEVVLAT
eukprot:scaffold45823_cov175-Skeletonema_marinoi.AAC.2